MRVGQGFDVHKLVPGRKLILGGVELDYPKGLVGHSDADVAIHALIDALLGAACLGDIGMHFPDSDPANKDASSMEMLNIIYHAVKSLDFNIANVDLTIITQEPKIAPYRAKIVENIASALDLEPGNVNVKAKTTEGLGFLGRSEGIAALAIVLLER